MTRVQMGPGRGGLGADPYGESPPALKVGVSVVVTVVEAPACHLCEDAKSSLAVLARSYPLTINVVSMAEEAGRALMRAHRAPMSPLVLLDGVYFSSGRLPRRKLERALEKARGGQSSA